MPRALWFLIGLRLHAWLRRLGRSLRTLRGLLLGLLGVSTLALWAAQLALVGLARGSRTVPNTEGVLGNGPYLLLLWCLLAILSTARGPAIYFTPAEVHFLFAGPFTRRQLLGYKLLVSTCLSLVGAVVLTLVFRGQATHFWAAFVGVALATTFAQLVGTAGALAAAALGARAFTRARRAILAVLVMAAVAALLQSARSLSGGWEAWRQRLDHSAVVGALLVPLRWFVRAFAAEHLWPDLVLWGGLGLAVNAALVVAVLIVDAHYLEAAAIASERLYARQLRARRGQVAWSSAGGQARLRLPNLPWWCGVGPLAWRQALGALRSLRALLLTLAVTAVMMLGGVMVRWDDALGDGDAGMGVLAGLVPLAVFMMPVFLTFDFRGDLEHMETLKVLPLPSAALVMGELMTPVLLASCIQVALLAGVCYLFSVRVGPLGWFAVFAPAVNCLVFALENAFFLLFPTRHAAHAPGDFQMMGRRLVFALAKVLIILVAGGLAASVAVIAYFLFGESRGSALVTAWITLALMDAGLILLLAQAFRRFDVARDMPP